MVPYPVSVAVVLAATVLWVWLARRMAIARGRRRLPWMLAAALFGPVPLLVLLIWPKRTITEEETA